MEKFIKNVIEFEKQMKNLKAITSKDNKKIERLVNWYRNEFIKRPEKYPGDDIALVYVKNFAAKGFSLEIAIQQTYSELNKEFAIIDKNGMWVD